MRASFVGSVAGIYYQNLLPRRMIWNKTFLLSSPLRGMFSIVKTSLLQAQRQNSAEKSATRNEDTRDSELVGLITEEVEVVAF